MSVGAPPFAAGPLGAVTDETRYRELAGWFPDAVVAGRGCTCQVRIDVKDRDQAVDVLARIRPWLPALLALTVNSPFADGRDTGWASYRSSTGRPSGRRAPGTAPTATTAWCAR